MEDTARGEQNTETHEYLFWGFDQSGATNQKVGNVFLRFDPRGECLPRRYRNEDDSFAESIINSF